MQAGEQIAGRYRLDARLGRGGMGEVWQGFDTELARPVALKVLLEAVATADEAMRRFRREASIGARLAHPGITAVHDIGHHDGRMFLVMELLEGEDLARLLKRSPKGLAVSEALDLGAQAAEVLAAAHAGKVIHRDLKPANLFLLTDGRLKICDFGIARTAETAEALTITGHPLGSPPFMAPEQWRGEHVDAGCDVYALGCVLFALLTGEPPFAGGGGAWALMRRHLEEAPPDPRSVRPYVPACVAELVAELLAKDPADRPGAARTAERLRELHDLHAPSTDTAPPPVAASTAHPHPLPLPLSADGPPTDRPPASPRPRRRNLLLGGIGLGLAGASAGVALLWKGTDGSPPPRPQGRSWFTLRGLRGDALAVAFSSDGNTILTGERTGDVEKWDLTERDPMNSFRGDIAPDVVAFSPDGSAVAAAGHGSRVRLWDSSELPDDDSFLIDSLSTTQTLAFSPDGRTLATGGEDHVELWDVGSRRKRVTLTDDAVSASALAFSPDGKLLATTDGGHVLLWSVTRGQRTADIAHKGPVTMMAFSPRGTLLAVVDGSIQGTIQLWDTATRRHLATLRGGPSWTCSVVFSPNGSTLATGHQDGSVKLWNMARRASTDVLTGHVAPVNTVAFSPDGKVLASAGDDNTVHLWKIT
ncbi:WD40 repeat domain-containing serine/threonine protein kinase [Streptomyces odontomachi]|uniref:WD40 repeat domain-containing serine/threonine protein kinase n=1 Tax=Streptomyces odontomachi TaxID=2944940 RepID=UPI00210EA795|nr:serine/threonine-protein kinase [Streptomyces sp. ODS25]